MSVLIKNGRIVTATDDYEGDIFVSGSKVDLIGKNLSIDADQVVDAGGKLVIPGGIDPHTHLELPFGGTVTSDTFETGTRAAAYGGTTCIIDFAVQLKGEDPLESLEKWHLKAAGKTAIDYCFHMILTDVPESHWLVDDYYDEDPSAPDKTYAKRGGFLEPVDFDSLGFGVPPTILPATDTAQLLALVVAQRVLQDAAQGQFADLDNVGRGLRADRDPERELPVEMAAEIELALLVVDRCDVSYFQITHAEGKILYLLDRVEASDHANDEASPCVGDLANRLIEVAASNHPSHIRGLHAVLLEGIEMEVDAHLLRENSVQAHLGDTWYAQDRPYHESIEQIVAVAEVDRRAQSSFDDGVVGLLVVPVAADGDILQVLGQVAAYSIDLLPDLDPGQIHVSGPVELQPNLAAVVTCAAPHASQAVDRAESVFDRPHDASLYLFRCGTGVREPNEDPRLFHVRLEGEWYSGQRNGAEDDHADEDHQRRHVSLDGQIGKSQFETSSSSSSTGRGTRDGTIM